MTLPSLAPTPSVPPASAITQVAVVVPARDEERLLPRCLAALADAERLAEAAGLRTQVLVVLDRCVDTSAAVARRAGVATLETTYGVVGAARAQGAAHVIRGWLGAGVDLSTAWLAGTDADSVVPPGWLARQVALADAGADCVVGTVEPHGLSGTLAEAWWARHRLGEGHGHVHGANLGVRASAYVSVGGFAPVSGHEDVELVGRLRAAGHRCVATDSARVRTSGRLRSRVEGGFATYLAGLAGV